MTFTFPEGVSALVGPNGSGKSTLLERVKRSKLQCGEFLPTDVTNAYMQSGMRAILADSNYYLQPPYGGGGETQAYYHTHKLAFASPGDVVVFDEPENSLHPFGIRQFMQLAREQAESRDLTIILATHSPVILDAFRAEPDRVFVLKFGQKPVALDVLYSREWLASYTLGDLFVGGEFGGPQ